MCAGYFVKLAPEWSFNREAKILKMGVKDAINEINEQKKWQQLQKKVAKMARGLQLLSSRMLAEKLRDAAGRKMRSNGSRVVSGQD
jgi:hypothetical protein